MIKTNTEMKDIGSGKRQYNVGKSFGSHSSATELIKTYTNRVVAGIVLSNASQYTLTLSSCHRKNGQVEHFPSVVEPNTEEIMVGYGGLLSGSCGVVSWRIGQTDWYLFVMWSAPTNFNHYSNWLSIGFKSDHTTDEATFKDMYYKEETWFVRKEYYSNISPIEVSGMNDQLVANGSMGTDHKCVARIELLPNSKIKTKYSENKTPESKQHCKVESKKVNKYC